MQFYQKNICVFIQIIDQHPLLFSKYKTDLNKLLDTLPENIENISKAISKWYKKHPEILKIQLGMLASSAECDDLLTRGAFGSRVSADDADDDKKLREQLLNAIRRISSQPRPQDKANDKHSSKTSD